MLGIILVETYFSFDLRSIFESLLHYIKANRVECASIMSVKSNKMLIVVI